MIILDKKYSFFAPKKIFDLKRYGRSADGGYVCSKKIVKNTNVLVTFGMGPDWSFEIEYIKDNPNVTIFVYDYTVSVWPYIKEVYKYLKRFITFRGKWSYVSNRYSYLKNYLNFFKLKNIVFYSEKITYSRKLKIDTSVKKIFERVDNLFSKNEEIILKSDIEGNEFEIIDDILIYQDRIKMIIFEFHWLDKNEEIFLQSIKKFQKYFEVIHVHGNNHCETLPSGLPIALEMTLINKKYINSKNESEKKFPINGLDFPNNPSKKDISFTFDL